MKIGDTDNQKIQPGQIIDCENGCSANAVSYFNGTPYCTECLHAEQQKKWENDGSFFLNSEGERVHFEAIRRISIETKE
jgi:hypothetical protein